MCQLLTREEAAELLNITVGALDRFRYGRALPYIRLGRKVRIKWTDLVHFVTANRVA